VKIRMPLRVGVIADNQRNFAFQLADALAVEKIDKAVIVLGNQNRNARPMTCQRHAPAHSKFFGDRMELCGKIRERQLKIGEVPLHARKIERILARLVLLKMQDVPVMPVNKIRNRRVQTFLVTALDQQDGAVLQNSSP